MLPDPRTLILFGTNALLLYLTLLVNSALAAWSLHLLLLGPMIILPALYLRHGSFFLTVLLTGLWVDAALPAPFGLFTVIFAILGTAIFSARLRFRPEHNYHPVLIAHAANLACILCLSIFAAPGSADPGAFLLQAAMAAVLSHLVLLPVAPWFFNLQRLCFEICRVETEPEDFPLI